MNKKSKCDKTLSGKHIFKKFHWQDYYFVIKFEKCIACEVVDDETLSNISPE